MASRYPEERFELATHPPPALNVLVSKLVTGLQLAGVAAVVGGDPVLHAMGVQHPPPLLNWVRQNKLQAGVAVWVVGNVAQNALLSTGAFEISFNGVEVFSKLKENRMPTFEELVAKCDEAVTSYRKSS